MPIGSRLPGFNPKLFAAIGAGAKVYELSHAMAPSMPVYHQHIPYSLALHRRQGDPHPAKREDGSSFANEVIVTSGHSGTHIDASVIFPATGACTVGSRFPISRPAMAIANSTRPTFRRSCKALL